MAFSIAVRAKPRGAARSCSHSCSVRLEICNFNAASLCERLFRSRHARSLLGNAPAANLWCRTWSGSVPKAILECYTWITYSIKSAGQNDWLRLHPAFSPFGLPVHLIAFPAFRFVRSSSFRHSAFPLCCLGRRCGTGRPCFWTGCRMYDFEFVSRHLPPHSTASSRRCRPCRSSRSLHSDFWFVRFSPRRTRRTQNQRDVASSRAGLLSTESNSPRAA